MESYFSMGK